MTTSALRDRTEASPLSTPSISPQVGMLIDRDVLALPHYIPHKGQDRFLDRETTYVM